MTIELQLPRSRTCVVIAVKTVSRLEPDSGEVCNYPHLRVGDTGENIAQPFLRIDVALIWWTPPLPASQCAKCGCRKSDKGDPSMERTSTQRTS